VFTDDKGVTIELDHLPERVVADVNAAAPLWDFGVRPIGVFGWNASETGDFGDAGGNIDPDAVEVAGNTAEPVQLEKMAALDPDLIITITWTPDDETEYWSIDLETLPLVQSIAPLLAMSATGSADVNTERFAELAAALGADLETPELAEAKERYDAALTDLQAATAEKAGIQVLFLYVDSETIYVANPGDWADLTFYQNAGLNIITPDAEPGSYWEQLSFEQALKYPADLIMSSSRPGTLALDKFASHPTLGAHPAVIAGQVVTWNQDFIQSYQGMAEAMEHLASTLRDTEKIL
jgi:iron complex transport system substrate-binding protein